MYRISIIGGAGDMAPEGCVDPAEFTRRMTAALPDAEEAMQVEVKEV